MIELLCCLAVWRVSSLLVNEVGPFEIFARFRYAIGVRTGEYLICYGKGIAGAFCCIWCISVWVAAFAAVALALWRGDSLFQLVIDWFAFSAGTIFVHKVVN